MNNIYCSTILLEGLEKAINPDSKIFDKTKLELPFGSTKNYIWFSQINNKILEAVLNQYEIFEISEDCVQSLKIKNKVYKKKLNDSNYFPIILARKDFIEENNFNNIGILIFEKEKYKISGKKYKEDNFCLTPSQIQIKHVLGIKKYDIENKCYSFKDISDKYFD